MQGNTCTSYSYDALGRVTTIDYPTGTPDVSYAYDAAGNVLTMTDGLGTTSYTYDALHRMETRTRDGRAVSYSYLPTGQVGTLTYWDRGDVVATYDDAGRLATLAPWGAQPTSYTWRATGLPATITRPNGVTTTFSYDPANQLKRIQHQRGATTLNDLGYTLDLNGNRSAISEVLGGATLTTSYQYDPLGRLKQASYPAIPGGPAAQIMPYTLDPAGNRLGDGTTTQTYDAADRIAGFQYDAVGNLLNDGTTSYAYDGANRLVQTTSGGVTTTYGYDGWGTLVRETRAGVTTDFVLDEQAGLPRVLAAIRADGTEELYAYGPDGLLAQRTISGATDQTSYALLDAQASLLHLTDSTGSLTLTRVYDAWGSLRFTTGSATSRLGYTGELMGQDGTVYLRARHYLPQLGRFLQRDSFSGIPGRPQSLHRYTYAEHNPARFTDQTGRSVDQYGRWTPCNLLPGRADTCTAGDFVDWWGTDDGDKFRTLTWTITTDFWDTLVWGPGDLAWGLVTDPGGTVYNVLVFPVTTLKNLGVGTLCGDPVMMGHGISGYAMLVVGPLKKSMEKPVPGGRGPHIPSPTEGIPSLNQLPHTIRPAALRGLSVTEVQQLLPEHAIRETAFDGGPKWSWREDGATWEVRYHEHANPAFGNNSPSGLGPTIKFGRLVAGDGVNRLTSEQMLAIDQKLVQQYGIPEGHSPPTDFPGTVTYYIDPFGWVYYTEENKLGGRFTNATHIIGTSHPWR